ncbi:hypothetical protein [Pedobacter metabolipauper]|uniref:Uncharacterized protein n=1 Tax=Pedobacter metabolipauper TaxID=425513 RepID=A0A4V3D1R9_9SPHI|nr:hypothetical protein [Pedobacter metabolipauper]TDQ12805.1 hypothetical protein ATK78_0012 [Pedobacter metabolipauper]
MGNLNVASDSTTLKLKEIIKGLNDEIQQYEKAVLQTDEHAKFFKGNIAGLRRSKTTLEIFFQKQLEDEKNG